MKPPPNLFLTVNDIAARWQVSARTVRRLIARGDLKTHRIGAQLRVSAEDLAVYERLQRGTNLVGSPAQIVHVCQPHRTCRDNTPG